MLEIVESKWTKIFIVWRVFDQPTRKAFVASFIERSDAELFVKAKEQAEWEILHPPFVPVPDYLLSCGHLASEMVRNQIDGNSGIDCQVCDDACKEWDKRNA